MQFFLVYYIVDYSVLKSKFLRCEETEYLPLKFNTALGKVLKSRIIISISSFNSDLNCEAAAVSTILPIGKSLCNDNHKMLVLFCHLMLFFVPLKF